MLVLGIAYKKNVDDMRESPSIRIIERLEARGAMVEYYDPFIPVIPMTRDHAALAGRRSVLWSPEALAGFDAALIATDHDGLTLGRCLRTCRLSSIRAMPRPSWPRNSPTASSRPDGRPSGLVQREDLVVSLPHGFCPVSRHVLLREPRSPVGRSGAGSTACGVTDGAKAEAFSALLNRRATRPR